MSIVFHLNYWFIITENLQIGVRIIYHYYYYYYYYIIIITLLYYYYLLLFIQNIFPILIG